MEHLYTLLTVCHRKSTLVCGSRMQTRCMCTVQCRIVTRDFAQEPDCRSAVKRGLNVLGTSMGFFFGMH